jgi:hypothetical protein
MKSVCPALPFPSHAVSMSTAHSVLCCFYAHCSLSLALFNCPFSLVLFLCPLPTQSCAVSVPTALLVSCCSTVHLVSCCFYVHLPLSLVLFLRLLPNQSYAVSMSSAQSVLWCFCPLPSQSRAVFMFIAHSVSCYFCIHCPVMFKERCTVASKVSVKSLALLLPIHEAQLQISACRQARRANILWFPSVPPGNSGIVSQIRPRPLSLRSFVIHCSLIA